MVRLRGNRQATHHRIVRPHHTKEGLQPENLHKPDPLVEPHKQHRTIKLRGTTSSGERREVEVDYDKLKELRHHALEHQHPHHSMHLQHDDSSSHPHVRVHYPHHKVHHETSAGHDDEQQRHPQVHIQVPTTESQAPNVRHPHGHHHVNARLQRAMEEDEEEEHQPPVPAPSSHQEEEAVTTTTDHPQHHHHEHTFHHQDNSTTTESLDVSSFNQTLYEHLYWAPFDIYEQAMALEEPQDEDSSFPVWTVPTWMGKKGVYSAFGKTAEPLIFEHEQELLDWTAIQAVSNHAPAELEAFLGESQFEGSLILAKYFGEPRPQNDQNDSFLGLVMSYIQFGVQKHVLVPLARLDDFFDHDIPLHKESTQHLEVTALHELIMSKLSSSNDTSTDQAILQSMEQRSQLLENLHDLQFQQLYQVLIRRSYLFSYGFADCLHQDPYALRDCLDETFDETVRLETKLRGAMAQKLQDHVGSINQDFHSTVQEACWQAQNSNPMMGTNNMYVGSAGSCHSINDLQQFVAMSS